MLVGRERRARPSALERLVAAGLGGGRLAIGAGLWLAPDLARRGLGFGELGPTSLALGRIAASRDLVLGAWQLRALGDRDATRSAAGAIALADAGDALTFALALGAGPELRGAAIRGLIGGGVAAAGGAWLASR